MRHCLLHKQSFLYLLKPDVKRTSPSVVTRKSGLNLTLQTDSDNFFLIKITSVTFDNELQQTL